MKKKYQIEHEVFLDGLGNVPELMAAVSCSITLKPARCALASSAARRYFSDIRVLDRHSSFIRTNTCHGQLHTGYLSSSSKHSSETVISVCKVSVMLSDLECNDSGKMTGGHF